MTLTDLLYEPAFWATGWALVILLLALALAYVSRR